MTEVDRLHEITPEQKHLIKKSFSQFIEEDMAKSGLDMFVKMLIDNPNLKHLFPFCEQLPNEKLHECAALKRHGFNVMLSMSRAISLLDNQRQLKWNMNALGTRHGYRNVKPEYFQHMEKALHFVMNQKLGDKYTPAVAEAWKIWFQSVAALMSQGIRSYTS